MASFFLRDCNQIPLGTLIEAGEWREEHTHTYLRLADQPIHLDMAKMLTLGCMLCRCFCESSVTNMVKDFDYVLDLGKLEESTNGLSDIVDECTAGRAPPLTPADFRVALSTKSFTSKKADEEMVAKLYESTFESQLAKAKQLICSNLSWGDVEVEIFAKVVASGALASLQNLYLDDNQIGDAGMSAFASACASGALDHLMVCWLLTPFYPCPETWHVHSPDPEVLFDVQYAVPFACWQQDWQRRHDIPCRRSGEGGTARP